MTANSTNTLAASADEPLFRSPADVSALWNQAIDWLLHHWLQIAIASGIATALVLAMLLVRGLGNRLCSRPHVTHWQIVIGRVITKTGVLFMILLAARLVSGYAKPPAMVASTVEVLWTIVSAVQVAVWARELIIGFIEQRAGDADGSTLGSAMGIVRLLVTVMLFAIAGVVILDNLGVNVTGLIAGLGIGGIAIGLAAKGIFDDLFSALSIIFDKPFRRGDSIRWDSTSGTVEAIGLKTTRVRAVTGEEVVISNTNLLNKELHNMARLARRRNVLTLGVTYETPQAKLESLPALVKEIVEREDRCKMIRCGLASFGASSLDYELQFDVMSEVYDVVFDARNNVMLAILKRFAEEGIVFAYPTQLTYTAAPDGRLVMPWSDHSNGDDARTAAPPPLPDVREPKTSLPVDRQTNSQWRRTMPTDAEIESKFWSELKSSPFVMLGLDGARDGHTQPMTAQFEGDAGPLWFFTTKDNGLVAALGQSHRAIASYTSKGHDLFATIDGNLAIDTDPANVDRLWNSHVAAWYEGGKTDPKLALLRLDTEKAELWKGGSTIGAAISRLFGADPKDSYKDNQATVAL